MLRLGNVMSLDSEVISSDVCLMAGTAEPGHTGRLHQTEPRYFSSRSLTRSAIAAEQIHRIARAFLFVDGSMLVSFDCFALLVFVHDCSFH